MRQFSEQAVAIYAAVQGKGTAFALLQESALQSFAAMETLAEETRRLICDRNELPETTGWATLDKTLSGPVKTLYVYLLALRKFAKARNGVVHYYVASGKGPARTVTLEPFDLGRITASVATSNQSALKAEAERLAAGKGETEGKTDTPKADTPKAEPAGLNVDAVIAQLVAMHKAGALTAAQIETLASIKPAAVKPAPVVQRVDGLALAA